jgi:hypothetical protein
MTRYALKVEGSIPGFNTNLSIELDPKEKCWVNRPHLWLQHQKYTNVLSAEERFRLVTALKKIGHLSSGGLQF